RLCGGRRAELRNGALDSDLFVQLLRPAVPRHVARRRLAPPADRHRQAGPRGPGHCPMTARLLLDCRNIVGESALWALDEQRLYWVDIVGSRIHRLDPATGAHDSWQTPELPTSIGLTKAGDFIVGLRQRVVRWQPGGDCETFAVPEPDQPASRLNEGVVAPDGSFWVGTMEDNI